MNCKIDGCDKPVRSKTMRVCEMHYIRKYRRGTYDDPVYKHRYLAKHGYVWVCAPDHPLARRQDGRVYEHRKVFWDAHGDKVFSCWNCGCNVSWDSGIDFHIDHINKNKSDNRLENLRPSCRTCNTGRSPNGSAKMIEIDGVKKPITHWMSDPRVRVTYTSACRRLRKGIAPKEALFTPGKRGPKVGHKDAPRDEVAKHYREQIRLMQADESHELESWN